MLMNGGTHFINITYKPYPPTVRLSEFIIFVLWAERLWNLIMKRKVLVMILLTFILSVPLPSSAKITPVNWVDDFGTGSYKIPAYQAKFGKDNRWHGVTIPNTEADGSYTSITFPGGMFGKTGGDKVLKREEMIASNSLTAALNGMQYIYPFKRDPFLVLSTPHISWNAGEQGFVLHVTSEFAYENFKGAGQIVRIQPQFNYYDADNKKQYRNYTLFEAKGPEGTVTMFGQAANNQGGAQIMIGAARWSRIDVLIYGDLGMEGYIDGEKVSLEGENTNGRYYPAIDGVSTENWIGFDTCRFIYVPQVHRGHYRLAKIYFDNTGVSISTQAPTIPPYSGYDTSKVKLSMSDVIKEGSTPMYGDIINFRPDLMGTVKYAPTGGMFGKAAADTIYEISNTSDTMPVGRE